jgi:hypothetical protein
MKIISSRVSPLIKMLNKYFSKEYSAEGEAGKNT